MAPGDHRITRRRDEPQGRGPWRTVRNDGDQGGACGARRNPFGRAGASLGARYESRDGGAARLFGVEVPAREDGTVRAEDVRRQLAAHEGKVAAIMLTNPNTCGLFEPRAT